MEGKDPYATTPISEKEVVYTPPELLVFRRNMLHKVCELSPAHEPENVLAIIPDFAERKNPGILAFILDVVNQKERERW